MCAGHGKMDEYYSMKTQPKEGVLHRLLFSEQNQNLYDVVTFVLWSINSKFLMLWMNFYQSYYQFLETKFQFSPTTRDLFYGYLGDPTDNRFMHIDISGTHEAHVRR